MSNKKHRIYYECSKQTVAQTRAQTRPQTLGNLLLLLLLLLTLLLLLPLLLLLLLHLKQNVTTLLMILRMGAEETLQERSGPKSTQNTIQFLAY